MIKNPVNHRALATVFAVALLSAGCASVNLQSHVAQSPEQALELAGQEDNRETAQRYLLRIASRFQDQGDHMAARTLLQSPQLTQPAPGLESQKRLLAMASATALDDSDWARTLAASLSPDSITEYSPNLMNRAARLQAETYTLAGEPLPAAMTLILLTQTDSQANPQQLHDLIWQQLKTVPDRALETANSEAIGYEAEGWLELAMTVRAPGIELDQQGRTIDRKSVV